ncbi:MAG: hypothetical protein R3B95_10125 [Nitrospirales bacterium]|nr:hypothetical protein [Nitrospirales bacterium]
MDCEGGGAGSVLSTKLGGWRATYRRLPAMRDCVKAAEVWHPRYVMIPKIGMMLQEVVVVCVGLLEGTGPSTVIFRSRLLMPIMCIRMGLRLLC